MVRYQNSIQHNDSKCNCNIITMYRIKNMYLQNHKIIEIQ